MLRAGLVVVAVLTSLGFASSAGAMATYVYEGSFFDTIEDTTPPAGTYDTSMRVTGSFTITLNELPPNLGASNDLTPFLTDLVLSDGRQTLALSDSDLLSFVIFTDADAAITSWVIRFSRSDAGLFSSVSTLSTSDTGIIALASNFNARDRGKVSGDPGTWTLVPEPATAGLMALGILGLAALGRSRR